MSKTINILILVLILCASLFAQNKIAVINSDAFYDERLGISELVIANKRLEIELKPQIEKFNNLGKEISDMLSFCTRTGHCSLEMTEKKIAEYEKQSKQLTQTLILQYEKSKSEIVEPVNKRIAEKLKLFAKQKDYENIFDLKETEDSSGVICPFDNLTDVTKEFIKFCNEEFEKENILLSQPKN